MTVNYLNIYSKKYYFSKDFTKDNNIKKKKNSFKIN